jgi:amidase
MIRWLQEDFKLDAHATHILLGQCAEYDVGNAFDPAYTMICKLKKSIGNPMAIFAPLCASA